MGRKVDEGAGGGASNSVSDIENGDFGDLSSLDITGFSAVGNKLSVPFTDVYSEWDQRFIRDIAKELRGVAANKRRGLFQTRWGELKRKGVKRLKISRNDFSVFKIEDVENILIQDAIIRPRAGWGVYIEDSNNVAVTSCEIVNTDDDMLYYTPRAGVKLEGKTKDIRVNKNFIRGFRYGVGDRLGGSHNNIQINRNVIVDCIYGISIKKVKYLRIIGNIIRWQDTTISDPYYVCGINVSSGAFGQDSEMESSRWGIIKDNSIRGIKTLPLSV